MALRKPEAIGDGVRSIIMVGAFPPPVHGMAVINAAMYDRLRDLGVAVEVMNIGADDLRRSLKARMSRLPRVGRALVRLARLENRRHNSLYMSVSGGFGQAYEVAFLILARLRGCLIVLHHHSYAYLDKRSIVTALLTGVAGPRATHVVLTPGMGTRLRAQYPRAYRQLAVSNAALLIGGDLPAVPERSGLRTIGFLSNLSAEKGVFVFLDLCKALRDAGMPVRARLAGPFADGHVEDVVRGRLQHLGNVEYVGPQYGAQKDAFYSSIDAFVFPTLYANEAEPLSIHEAMRHGLPTLAFARGAIGELIDGTVGLAVDKDADFVSSARTLIARWVENPAQFTKTSENARRKFETMRLQSTSAVEALEQLLSQGR
jgi:glycosyltransferase involved in cell wall biosynthesis